MLEQLVSTDPNPTVRPNKPNMGGKKHKAKKISKLTAMSKKVNKKQESDGNYAMDGWSFGTV